ncbi:hypothetical protein [Nocardiopsis alba]|uniref:hypothetical protein n=1 Tax=Nocardiopsis alba TaxID=53437 RepID=UPI003D7260BA
MDTTTAAQAANVTVDTIRVWCRMGAVKATKRAGRWVIDSLSLLKRAAMNTRPTPNRRTTTMTVQETDITIEVKAGSLYLTAPYNPAANTDYKDLGARWDRDRRAWKFAARDLERVREICRAHFGYDDQPVKAVDVRVRLSGTYGRGDSSTAELEMFGRTLATRGSRDARVKLGRDVLLVEGEFEQSSGSMRYPAIGDVDGIVLEVRGVPADHPELDDEDVEIIETEISADEAEQTALRAEKAQLLARIAEIDAKLVD